MEKINLYVWATFDNKSGCGDYIYILEKGTKSKSFIKQFVSGHSATQLVLMAIIDGLKKVTRACEITVITNGMWGYSQIMNKIKKYGIIESGANHREKQIVLELVMRGGHTLLDGYNTNSIGILLKEYRLLKAKNQPNL